jgi:hypothetical protein
VLGPGFDNQNLKKKKKKDEKYMGKNKPSLFSKDT